MTRKHFEAMAAEIRTIADETIRKATAESMARFCKSQNGRFDRDRFIAACGC